MENKDENKEKSKLPKFLVALGTFLGKGFVLGKWEVKWTWRF